MKVILHQDNAPSHRAKMTQDLLRQFGWEVLNHPPYSPDLAPCDFFLFPKLKKMMKGIKFATETEVKRSLQANLKVLKDIGFRGVQTMGKALAQGYFKRR